MIEHWVGEDMFRAAVRRYLGDHRFGNATTGDFVSAIPAAGPMLSSFFDQAGVPVITAETRCDAALPTVILRQDRYVPLGAQAGAQVWNTPVCIKGEGLAERCVTMDSPETAVPVASCPSWLFANAGASGYYRTLLGPELLEALSRHGGELTAAERLVFAQDMAALVRNGRLPAGQAMGLLEWLGKDSEPLVVQEAARLTDMLALIVPPSLKPRFDQLLPSVPGVAKALPPRDLELFRAAQQKSLIEFLSR